jgi:hypothetical protein
VTGQLSAHDLGCWPNPVAKAAYTSHATGMMGVPPVDPRTRRACGDAAAGGSSSDKVSLGRRYKHEWRTTNPSEMERTATDGEGWRRWWPDGGTALMVQGSVSEVLWQEEENGKMIDNSI